MLANRNANGHEVKASTREGDRLTGTGNGMGRSYAGGATELRKAEARQNGAGGLRAPRATVLGAARRENRCLARRERRMHREWGRRRAGERRERWIFGGDRCRN